MNTVCVTGCTGFIGSTAVDTLLKRGYEVIGVDWFASNVTSEIIKKRIIRYHDIARSHNVIPQLEIINLTTDKERLRNVLVQNGVDTVLMFAAIFGGREYIEKYQTECALGFAIDQTTLRACYESGVVERIAYSSSACVYPNSLQKDHKYLLKESDVLSTGEGFKSTEGIYGFNKITTELQLQRLHEEFGISTGAGRFLTVYGPGEYPTTHALSMFIQKALRKDNPFIIWGKDGLQERGFTYVTDIVDGMISIANRITDGIGINLGWDKRYAIKDVANMIISKVGYTPRIVFDASKPEGPFSRALDISLARKLLCWEPIIDLPEGLERTIQWAKNNY